MPIFPPILESSLLEKFAKGIVYQRRAKTVAPIPNRLELASDPALASVDSTTSLHCSTCVSRPPKISEFSPKRYASLFTSLLTISIPRSYKQAFFHDGWKAVIQEELNALSDNHTWDFVLCCFGITPIGCKWPYMVKAQIKWIT